MRPTGNLSTKRGVVAVAAGIVRVEHPPIWKQRLFLGRIVFKMGAESVVPFLERGIVQVQLSLLFCAKMDPWV